MAALEWNFRRQLLNRGFAVPTAVQVGLHDEISSAFGGMGIADRLKCVNIERAIEPLHAPTHALVAGGQAIAFIERLGYHNPIFAIHEIHGSAVLEGDSDSQLQTRQPGETK